MDIEYLINKYSNLLYKICIDMLINPEDAQDALQEIYINIYKNLHKYKNVSENEIKNIICKIALNKCRDILKSKANKFKNNSIIDIECLENYEIDNDIEFKIYEQERKMHIIKTINELKKPYNEVLYEYYIEQRSLDEIASLKSTSKATIKLQIYRGKSKLKEKLKINGGDSFL